MVSDDKTLRCPDSCATSNRSITLREYAEIWLQRIESRHEAGELKFSTYKSYKTGCRKLKSAKFYNMPLVEINKIQLKEFVTNLYKKLAGKTVANQLTPLRQIFEEAFDEDIITVNHMSRVKNPEIEKPEPVPFTKDEVKMILDYFHKNYPAQYAYVAVLFYTGMRVGEALAMKWENFDFNNWTYHVKETRTEGRLTKPKTKSSIRRINLVKPLQKIIQTQKSVTMMKSEFVFLTGEGMPYHKAKYIIDKCWKPALRILGIEYRDMYQLRHTHAIQSLIVGDNPHDVSKRLGHSSLQVTFSKYAKFLPEETKPSMLEHIFSNLREPEYEDSVKRS
jgi:integrase